MVFKMGPGQWVLMQVEDHHKQREHSVRVTSVSQRLDCGIVQGLCEFCIPHLGYAMHQVHFNNFS